MLFGSNGGNGLDIEIEFYNKLLFVLLVGVIILLTIALYVKEKYYVSNEDDDGNADVNGRGGYR